MTWERLSAVRGRGRGGGRGGGQRAPMSGMFLRRSEMKKVRRATGKVSHDPV